MFVAPGFSEPGGCAAHGRKIAEGLVARGWRVHVVARRGSGRRPLAIRRPGLLVIEIPGFDRRWLGGALFLMLAIPMAVIRRPPHAFLAMQLSSPTTAAGISAWLWHRPLLVFSTSTGPGGEVAFVEGSRLSPMRRALLARATFAIAQTDDGAAELRTVVPQGRVVVVPTPVRLDEDVPALTGAPVAAYTGRLVRGKNLDILLRVWRRVARVLLRARLLLVGCGATGDPTEHRLAAMISSDQLLAETVTLTGWVSDVSPYLRTADVFVFPSEAEGMSNSLLEACALGRVVVASDIPANRAVLGDRYPLLIDPRDLFGFERALLAGLSVDAQRVEARAQVLERRERFGEQRVLDSIECLLEHTQQEAR